MRRLAQNSFRFGFKPPWPHCFSSPRILHGMRDANARASELLQERQKTEQQLVMAKREAMIMMDPTSVKIDLWGKDSHPTVLEAKWHSKLGVCVMGEKVP